MGTQWRKDRYREEEVDDDRMPTIGVEVLCEQCSRGDDVILGDFQKIQ